MATKKKRFVPSLSKKEVRFLRGLAHTLDPLVMIGQHGLTPQVVQSTEDVLRSRELIKVKVQSTADVDRAETGAKLAKETGSALVQIIGGIIILYRPNKDLPPDQVIHIPKG